MQPKYQRLYATKIFVVMNFISKNNGYQPSDSRKIKST